MSENEQIRSLTRELDLTRERYQNLLNLNIQLQNQNCLLEERILSIVETYSNEKNQLEDHFLQAKNEILHLKETNKKLENENHRYKNDCQLAVGLLQQYPNEFISKLSDDGNHQENLSNRFESGLTNSIVIPTFPPVFVPPPTLLNMTIPVTHSNLHQQSSSTRYLCSKCHKLVNHSDVAVQTSFDNFEKLSNQNLHSDIQSIFLESHNHPYMTVKEYQKGTTRKFSHDYSCLSSNSIPQMHHV